LVVPALPTAKKGFAGGAILPDPILSASSQIGTPSDDMDVAGGKPASIAAFSTE
jgi:hypothetical protein